MELISFSRLREVLEEYGRQAVEMYKYQLSLGDKKATGKLMDTVTAEVNANGQDYEVILNLEEYWKYVEFGAQGTKSSPAGAKYPAHFPPPDALVAWIHAKPILPRPLTFRNPAKGEKIPSPETLAFLIGRKIQEHGIEPHPALATTIEEVNKNFEDKLVVALSQDMQDYINKAFITIVGEMPNVVFRKAPGEE